MGKCKAPGCTNDATYVAKSLCAMHNMRLRRHGTLENPARGITIRGVTRTVREWADMPGCTVSHVTIRRRLERGMDNENAVFKPSAGSVSAAALVCCVDGCGGRPIARGLCQFHYGREYRAHGRQKTRMDAILRQEPVGSLQQLAKRRKGQKHA